LRRFHMPRTDLSACRLAETRLREDGRTRSSLAGNRIVTVPLRTETLTAGSLTTKF
jgi:hypothetical protein